MYSLRLRDVQGGLAFGKNAAMIFQETSDPEGAARANCVIGLAMLAGDAPDEATDYFRIGREAAGEKYPLENLRNVLLEGIAWFIRGNFSRVLEICPAAARAADGMRMRRWSDAARFILARAYFELGEYEEARKLLEFLTGETRRLGMEAAERVVSSWLGRCLAYRGDPAAGLDLLNGISFHPEALFFAAEAEFFRGNGDRVREKIDDLLRIPYEGDCFLGDAFLWKDGFYFLENLSVGRTRGSEVLPHLAKTFLAFSSGQSRENPAAIEDMSRLIREEKNPKNDPYNMLYYYWYGKILPESRDSPFEDKTTVLGRAVRHLQSRASRIDETAHTYAFQRKNYWNRQLMEEARRRNLI
jgi:tetratricopeptide (TPR) repeat protein